MELKKGRQIDLISLYGEINIFPLEHFCLHETSILQHFYYRMRYFNQSLKLACQTI